MCARGGSPRRSPTILPGGVDLDTVETNMVFVHTEAMGLRTRSRLIERLAALGVGAVPVTRAVRMVTHVDVDDDGIACAIDAWRADRRWRCEGAVMGLFQKSYPPEIAERDPAGAAVGARPGRSCITDRSRRSTARTGISRSPGSVEEPFTLSYQELRALPTVTVDADMHCVTGWTTLDNTLGGRSVPRDQERAKPTPERRSG